MTEEDNQKPIQLAKPTDIVCDESTETSLTISWKAVEHATDYIVFCKDVLSDSWDECETAMVSGVTTAVIENLYPTATFEVKVTATSHDKNYSDSEESESIFCDTTVGSCTPNEKKCCF